MRHNRRTLRLGRSPNERQAMLENLVTSLIKHQAIQTTLMKAKAAKRLADRVISLSKDDTLASRRKVFSYIQDHQLTSKLFKEVGPRFKDRTGGYTRILHLQRRKGDGATLALLELTEKEIKIQEAKPKAKKDRKDHAHEGHAHEPKHEEPKPAERSPEKTKEKPPQKGFFKNIGRFFRNKGG